ncbi:lipocalin-like domain-containing protein [Parabacteroides sp. AM08-6]|uniref:lipocalin-like domain-containing protein n=1 Tax=Parabacteroides sp. AM08-6 TaxID=2292053 RepID=UPI000F00FBE1|nr:lipocalin-like domain-containing protein [Parabacteroides sp. AM08-6]RHJ87924.1 hypothetical protein DW103_00620 [Parabacteroides sp. AM08-6]
MIRNLIIIVFGVFVLVSCSKDEQDKLFGKWQMQQVEENGVVQSVDTVYFNFEHSLFMYQIYMPSTSEYQFRYGYNTIAGDSILLEIVSNPAPVRDFLPLTDWTSDKRTYAIDKISGKQLILSSEGKKYTFRKF